ncbi:hypothetical protein PI124_g3798 [Phytophthora idaei]|nr:hypothetical protein PI125_g4824 [Phytophthora idaei]KAG3154336.1 hypothetical protein PI126_g9664 [Phytophthora idaei]KAG3251584.1 hypothetical protein PI124_g3798 [Phytophthora idaei]
MVLSVKKTLALALCVSTFAASEVAQSSALRTHPRRGLAGIHHTTQYAPKVVKQPKGAPVQQEDSGSSDSYDSYDSYDLDGSDSADVKLQGSEELDISSSQDLDLDLDGPADVDVDLDDGEGLDYSGEGDQTLDLSSSGDLDFSADASLDASGQMDTDIVFTDGSVDVELEDDEDYSQDLEFEDDEVVDEIIDVPEGAKSIHLRVHNGNVDLDIIKGAEKHAKSETQPEQKKEEQKKEETAATETKEETVSYAAEAKEWIEENGSKPAVLGGMIGAAVGIVGIAGVAIAKSRKRASEKSVLAEEAVADAEADAEVDEDAESESDSDSESDEDVEAGVTALTEENAEEEKKTSVVEGSV